MRIPKSRVQYKINLDELFGDSLTYNRATKAAIGQAIIDRIVERTQDLKLDKTGRSLGSYSKSYAESLDGQVFGKKAGARVNLTATGDMLGSLTITNETAKTITIGFDDPEQATKAFGHITGMEGHPFLDGKVKPRDFLGLPKTDLEAIASEFEDQARAVSRIEEAQTPEELERAILATIDELEEEIGIESFERTLGGG